MGTRISSKWTCLGANIWLTIFKLRRNPNGRLRSPRLRRPSNDPQPQPSSIQQTRSSHLHDRLWRISLHGFRQLCSNKSHSYQKQPIGNIIILPTERMASTFDTSCVLSTFDDCDARVYTHIEVRYLVYWFIG